MIDLHAHILPGIDDGSVSIRESLEMAAIAAGCGVQYLVATPHSNQKGRFENYYSDSLRARFHMLQKEIRDEGIPLKLVLGMEIFASEDLGRLIHEKKLIGLNGSRYYLVEWAFDEDPERIGRYLQMILREGKIPLIAHPERYFCVQEYPKLLERWKAMGCLFQVNKGSLFQRFGTDAQECAFEMLEKRMVTCLATDAHSSKMRTTYLRDGMELVTDQFGPEYAATLFLKNPVAILQDKVL